MFFPGKTRNRESWKNEIVREQFKVFATDKYIASFCAALSILVGLKLIKMATVYPDIKDHISKMELVDESVLVDGNIIRD